MTLWSFHKLEHVEDHSETKPSLQLVRVCPGLEQSKELALCGCNTTRRHKVAATTHSMQTPPGWFAKFCRVRSACVLQGRDDVSVQRPRQHGSSTDTRGALASTFNLCRVGDSEQSMEKHSAPEVRRKFS